MEFVKLRILAFDVLRRFPASFASHHKSPGDVKASTRLTILRWSVVCLLFQPYSFVIDDKADFRRRASGERCEGRRGEVN